MNETVRVRMNETVELEGRKHEAGKELEVRPDQIDHRMTPVVPAPGAPEKRIIEPQERR